MSTRVQRFLRAGGTLDTLRERYAVKAIPGVRYPNLVTLKYSQIDSPMKRRIVRECRGIVLDREDGWRVVARGFDKFFNYGEPHAAFVSWKTARVQEKLDGSLILVYHYDGAWRAATTGHPEAAGPVVAPDGSAASTFAELFWLTIGAEMPGGADRGLTYLFELCAPENRVVVPHERRRAVLLAVRNPSTGLEGDPSLVAHYANMIGVEAVRSFPLRTIDEIVASFTKLDPLTQEGYVVVDAAFKRVKVKHPGYVALHHLRYATSTRSLLDVCRRGESSELLCAFPELARQLDDMRERLSGYAAVIEDDYRRLCGIEDRKAFALEATKTTCPGALFALKDGKVGSALEYLGRVQLDGLIRALGLKDQIPAEVEP